MASGWRGFAVGVFGLTVLSTVVQEGPSKRLGGLFGQAAGVLDRLLDPKVPAIPDRAGTAQGTTSGPKPIPAGAGGGGGARAQ